MYRFSMECAQGWSRRLRSFSLDCSWGQDEPPIGKDGIPKQNLITFHLVKASRGSSQGFAIQRNAEHAPATACNSPTLIGFRAWPFGLKV